MTLTAEIVEFADVVYGFDVRRYGAIGNDAFDCSDAFDDVIDAVAAAGGGRVYIPFGIYKTTRAINYAAHPGINFFMEKGASIHPTTPGQAGIQGSGSNASFVDFSVIGTVHGLGAFLSGSGLRISGGSFTGATTLNTSAGNWCGGLFITSGDDIKIDLVKCSGNGYAADKQAGFDIQFGGNGATPTNWEVTRCSLTSTNVGINLAGYDSSNVLIEKNNCSGATNWSATTGGYGILLYTTAPNAGSLKNARVLGNYVSTTAGSGLYAQGLYGGEFSGNVLLSTCSVQTDSTLPVGAISLDVCSRVGVTGNEIKTSGMAGITVADVDGTRTGNEVIGNSIDGVVRPAIYLRGALADCSVIGNGIVNCPDCGIGNVDFGTPMPVMRNLKVLGNTIIGARAIGAGTVSCVAGAATFTVSQTGAVANGEKILIANVAYTCSAFGGGGTTCTLSGAPTIAALTAFAIPKLSGTVGRGIAFYGVQDSTFGENTVDNVCVEGIRLTDGSGGGNTTKRNLVIGGTVSDAGGSGGAPFGVLVNGTDCTVTAVTTGNGPLAAPQYGGINVVGAGSRAFGNNVGTVSGVAYALTGGAVGWGNFDRGELVNFVVGTPLITVASVAGAAGFRLPHGTLPTSPINGDVWTTTAGLFVRVNGVTKTVTLT